MEGMEGVDGGSQRGMGWDCWLGISVIELSAIESTRIESSASVKFDESCYVFDARVCQQCECKHVTESDCGAYRLDSPFSLGRLARL